jgi:hypothetical protein
VLLTYNLTCCYLQYGKQLFRMRLHPNLYNRERGMADFASSFFRPLELVPESGVYRVYHGDHRVAHEVTLLRGEQFPECKRCRDIVHFELVYPAPALDTQAFRIHLYEVPHPAEEEEEPKAA